MSLPRVYQAINAITEAFATAGIPKDRFNLDDDYAYRSIDEVLARLAPLLATHKLCILPRVLERHNSEKPQPGGEPLTHVAVRAAYDLVSVEDGSSHTIEAFGEALDASDKATTKAMTSAYKAAVLQAFCIPVAASEDPDRCSPRAPGSIGVPEPIGGWPQWSEDIGSVVGSCVCSEAIDRLLATHRTTLGAFARAQPEAYARLGEAITAKRSELATTAPPPVKSSSREPDPGARPARRKRTTPGPMSTRAALSRKTLPAHEIQAATLIETEHG